MNKKYIAHIITEYLGHTLNWVYTQIKYTNNYSHYVLTSKTKNLECYPIPMLFKPAWKQYHPYIVERVFRRLGYLPFPEYIAFSSALKKYPPLLMLCHFGWDGFFALGLKKRFGMPMITRFYGYDVGILSRIPLWRERYKKLFDIGDLVLAMGSHNKAVLENLGCPKEKIVVHHLGIKADEIKYRERRRLENKFRILIAATFKEKKGLEYALEAIHLVCREMPKTEISVKLIGDGVLKEKLQQMASQLGLDKQIDWLGYQPHDFFIQSLYDADVFLSPSVTAADGDSEGGFPMTLTEAQASGLPVISTIHDDIPEVVINGKTGLLAPERNSKTLAEALIKIMKSPEYGKEMATAARKHIEVNYDATKQGLSLEKIFSRFELSN